jgi:serine/alanine adding enzyme
MFKVTEIESIPSFAKLRFDTDFVIVNSLDQKVWRDFVIQHPHGNIFHTQEMYRVFESARAHRPLLRAAITPDGRVLALLVPVLVNLMTGPLRRLTTRSIAYGGVLCTPDLGGKEALKLLLLSYVKDSGHDALYTELRNLCDMRVIQPIFHQCGFAYEEHLSFLIDLTCPTVQLIQNIGSRTRKHIRQALRKGNISVEQVCNRDQIEIWYELVSKSYRAARVPLADRSLFEAAFDILLPQGMIQFWLARIGPAYVAASAELLYKDVIYGWYSGVDRAYSTDSPGELLMWHVLQWGAQAGYKVYDFGGAGRPGEKYGVRDFKAKFGGRLVDFGRNTRVHAPGMLRWSEWGYGIYRKLLGYL